MSEQPPQGPSQQPYPQQPPPYGYVAPFPRQTAGGAVTALVLGILGLVMCGPFTAIPAIIVGRKATREIDASQGRLDGRGTAQAGYILGIVGTVIGGLALLFVIFVFALGGLLSTTFDSQCSTTDSDGILVECG
jgi:hypothetical protein